VWTRATRTGRVCCHPSTAIVWTGPQHRRNLHKFTKPRHETKISAKTGSHTSIPTSPGHTQGGHRILDHRQGAAANGPRARNDVRHRRFALYAVRSHGRPRSRHRCQQSLDARCCSTSTPANGTMRLMKILRVRDTMPRRSRDSPQIRLTASTACSASQCDRGHRRRPAGRDHRPA